MDVHHQIIIILLFRVKFDGKHLTNDKVKAVRYITTIPYKYITHHVLHLCHITNFNNILLRTLPRVLGLTDLVQSIVAAPFMEMRQRQSAV